MKENKDIKIAFRLLFKKEPYEKIIRFEAIKTYEDYERLTMLEIFNRLKEFLPHNNDLKDLADSELRGFELIEDTEDGGKRTYRFEK